MLLWPKREPVLLLLAGRRVPNTAARPVAAAPKMKKKRSAQVVRVFEAQIGAVSTIKEQNDESGTAAI